MGTDYHLPWRRALLRILSDDTDMQKLVGNPARIFDNVPKNTVTPYIRLGEDLISDFGTKTETGQEFLSTIHTYDMSPTERGQERLNLVQSRIYSLLHERSQVVIVGDTNAYLIRFVDRIVRNEDGTNWHGIDRYRILV